MILMQRDAMAVLLVQRDVKMNNRISIGNPSVSLLEIETVKRQVSSCRCSVSYTRKGFRVEKSCLNMESSGVIQEERKGYCRIT